MFIVADLASLTFHIDRSQLHVAGNHSVHYVSKGERSGSVVECSQWLSGRVLDLRQRGHRFEPHCRHCVVSLSKTH